MERGHDLLAIFDVRLILRLRNSAFAIGQARLLRYNMAVRGHRAAIRLAITRKGYVDRSEMMVWIHEIQLVQQSFLLGV